MEEDFDKYDYTKHGDRRNRVDRREERKVKSNDYGGQERREGDERRETDRIAPQGNHRIGTNVQAVKVELPSQTDYISLVRQFVGGVAKKAGFTDIDIEKIELALDEACSNVLQHAYKFETNNRYEIELIVDKLKLDIIITDQGDSFQFHDHVAPDIEQHISELNVGGLGIFIMQQMMDEVRYESLPDSGNVLRMVKYISPKDAE